MVWDPLTRAALSIRMLAALAAASSVRPLETRQAEFFGGVPGIKVSPHTMGRKREGRRGSEGEGAH